MDAFTSQRVVNVTTSNHPAGENNSMLTDTLAHDPASRTGKVVEVKTEKNGNVGEGDAADQGGDKSKASNGVPSKSGSKKGASTNGDGSAQGKDDKGGNDGGDGNQLKRKGKEGEGSAPSNNENGGSSKNRGSKRQKRQAGGSEVT